MSKGHHRDSAKSDRSSNFRLQNSVYEEDDAEFVFEEDDDDEEIDTPVFVEKKTKIRRDQLAKYNVRTKKYAYARSVAKVGFVMQLTHEEKCYYCEQKMTGIVDKEVKCRSCPTAVHCHCLAKAKQPKVKRIDAWWCKSCKDFGLDTETTVLEDIEKLFKSICVFCYGGDGNGELISTCKKWSFSWHQNCLNKTVGGFSEEAMLPSCTSTSDCDLCTSSTMDAILNGMYMKADIDLDPNINTSTKRMIQNARYQQNTLHLTDDETVDLVRTEMLSTSDDQHTAFEQATTAQNASLLWCKSNHYLFGGSSAKERYLKILHSGFDSEKPWTDAHRPMNIFTPSQLSKMTSTRNIIRVNDNRSRPSAFKPAAVGTFEEPNMLFHLQETFRLVYKNCQLRRTGGSRDGNGLMSNSDGLFELLELLIEFKWIASTEALPAHEKYCNGRPPVTSIREAIELFYAYDDKGTPENQSNPSVQLDRMSNLSTLFCRKTKKWILVPDHAYEYQLQHQINVASKDFSLFVTGNKDFRCIQLYEKSEWGQQVVELQQSYWMGPFIQDVTLDLIPCEAKVKNERVCPTGDKCPAKNDVIKDSVMFQWHKDGHKKSYKPIVCDHVYDDGRKCAKSYKSDIDLKIHRKIHEKYESLKCPICCDEKIWKTKYKLFDHLLTHGEERLFSCDYCGKKFKTLSNLRGHLNIHMKKKFQCRICGLAVVKARDLVGHVRIHTFVKPYKCLDCEYEAAHKTSLNKHRFAKHGDDSGLKTWEKYKCKLCGHQCSSSTNLLNHMKLHQQTVLTKCKRCSQEFSTKFDAIEHDKTHEDERKFKCAMCASKFYTKNHLTYHTQNSHVPKSSCPYCTKYKSSIKCNLDRHIKTCKYR